MRAFILIYSFYTGPLAILQLKWAFADALLTRLTGQIVWKMYNWEQLRQQKVLEVIVVIEAAADIPCLWYWSYSSDLQASVHKQLSHTKFDPNTTMSRPR